MPEWIKFPLVLTIIGLISAASLAGLHMVTEPKKRAIEAMYNERALRSVIPDAKDFVPVLNAAHTLTAFYMAVGEKGEVIGYAVEGDSMGYGGPIRVMVGVDKSFGLLGIKVMSHKETPGLGDKIEEIISKKTWGTVLTRTSPNESDLKPYFQEQFKDQLPPVKLKKDGGKIESITGATISSKAIIDAVNSAVLKLRSAVE